MLRTEMGSVATYFTGTSCNASCPTAMKQILLDLIALVNITQNVVGRFFPVTTAMASYISQMSYTASISPIVFVYLKYIELYPGTKIDMTNSISLINLMDVYLKYNIPWIQDPMLSVAVSTGIITPPS
jgi:hypothetical protein